MRVRASFTSLLFFILLCGAYPSLGGDVFVEKPLEVCQSILREREEQIQISKLSNESIDSLEKCNGELAELYNPTLVAEENLKFDGFVCKIWQVGCVLKDAFAVDYLAISGPKTHANQIRKRMGEKALIRLSGYVDQYQDIFPQRKAKQDGLEVIVTKAYKEFSETDSWFAEGSSGFWGSIFGFAEEQTTGYRYEELKPVVGDVAYHFIRSEMSGFGFDLSNPIDQKRVDEIALRHKKSLMLCFGKAKRLESLNYCVDLLFNYASYSIGKVVVDKILETEFLSEVSSERQGLFIKKVDSYFNKCLPSYFYNNIEKSAFDRIKGCVYGTIIHAFKLVVEESIRKEMGAFVELNDDKILNLRELSLAQCEADDIYDSSSADLQYFDRLEKLEAEEFEEYLLSCQNKVKSFLVGEIIHQTILSESKLVEFYGDEIKAFTDRINKEHYPQCLADLKEDGKEAQPQFCKSYLFVAAVFDFFSDAIRDELREQIQELFGQNPPQDLSEDDLLVSVLAEVQECRGPLLKNSLKNPDWDRPSLEKSLISCLSKGISVITSMLSQKLVPIELANNSFVQQYNVTIGPNKTLEFAEEFSQCMDNGLADVDGLLQLTDILSVLKEECKFQSYKSAFPYILDQVLEAELIGAGLMGDEFARVMDSYKNHPESLYNLIPQAQDQNELNLLTEGADQKVLKHLVPPVVEILIESKAGNYLGPKTQKKIVKEVSKKFLKCTKDKPIRDCVDGVEAFAIEKVLKIVLPYQIEDEIKEATAHHISDADFDELYIKEVMAANLEYPTGIMMVKFLVEEMRLGKDITEITSVHAVPNTFRTLLVKIFKNNPKFLGKILKSVIQPQLDKRNKGWLVKAFTHDEIYQWDNIKGTPSGKRVWGVFIRILERLMTEADSTLAVQEMHKIADLVEAAAKEKNRELNRAKNRANALSHSSGDDDD